MSDAILRRVAVMDEPIAVHLGLGSNMGNRQSNLAKALDFLSQRLRMEKISPVYET